MCLFRIYCFAFSRIRVWDENGLTGPVNAGRQSLDSTQFTVITEESLQPFQKYDNSQAHDINCNFILSWIICIAAM